MNADRNSVVVPAATHVPSWMRQPTTSRPHSATRTSSDKPEERMTMTTPKVVKETIPEPTEKKKRRKAPERIEMGEPSSLLIRHIPPEALASLHAYAKRHLRTLNSEVLSILLEWVDQHPVE